MAILLGQGAKSNIFPLAIYLCDVTSSQPKSELGLKEDGVLAVTSTGVLPLDPEESFVFLTAADFEEVTSPLKGQIACRSSKERHHIRTRGQLTGCRVLLRPW